MIQHLLRKWLFVCSATTLLVALIGGLPGSIRVTHAAGNTWTVNDLGDSGTTTCVVNGGAGGPTCQLRDAMTQAQNGDTINFSVSGTLTLATSNNLPQVNTTLTIDGTGQAVTISGSYNTLFVQSTGILTLNAINLLIAVSNSGGTLTINNAHGASLTNDNGTLNVSNSTFAGNMGVVISGASFSASSTINITNSTFANNVGPAISVSTDGFSTTLNIANSTFSGNSAAAGAAIDAFSYNHTSAVINIANSTFNDNLARTGSAIDIGDSAITLNLTNATFSGNGGVNNPNVNPYYGGAALDTQGAVTVNNTIFANNVYGDCLKEPTGSFSGAHNLSDGSCPGTLGAATNVSSALTNNGGPTQTLAVLTGSNAINAAPPASCVYVSGGPNPLFTNSAAITTDQRGVTRPQGPGCSIGAYEFVVGPSITFTPMTLPGGAVLTNYSQMLTASGGTGPYALTISSGTLPPGLTLTNSGNLSGRLNAAGTFTFTITATDTNDDTGSQQYTIAVTPLGSALVVNSTSDVTATCQVGGTLCLRDAITAIANNGSITFSVSGTITLTAALPAINNTTTIDGTGQTVVISGQQQYQILTVNTGATATVIGLTIANGKAVAGAGLYNNGTLTLTNDTFTGNQALGSGYVGGAGGGVYNAGTATITGTVFQSNSSVTGPYATPDEGGGVYNAGTATLTTDTFDNNVAQSGCFCGGHIITVWEGWGGGLFNVGQLTVNGTGFSQNGAEAGAGMYNDAAGTLIVNSSTVTLNNATFDASNYIGCCLIGAGGGINNAGTLTVSATTFSNNTSVLGGGVNNSGTTTTTGSTFFSNTGYDSGGGFYNNGTLTLSNSTLANNASVSLAGQGGYGGAVYNAGTLNLGNDTIAGNQAISGGGTFNSSGVTKLGSIILAKNTLTASGAGADITLTGGSAVSFGNNLIGTATGVTISGGPNDQIGTDNAPIDPGLSPLALNPPGTTDTMALHVNSPAVGKGFCVWTISAPFPAVTTDQRGVTRPTPCAVGAFEGAVAGPIDSIGIFRNGTFYLRLHNSTGNADITVAFNPATKPYPVVGDWTGVGFDTVGVFNQNNGQFSLRNSNTPGTPDEQFVLGNANDRPLSGKWSASATHFGVGVFRPSNGLIYLKNSLATGFADYAMVLGIPGDVGVAGDWNSDSIDSPGVYRPSTQRFYLTDQVCNCSAIGSYVIQYGVAGDAPVVGDWTGQGHDGIGLFRQSNGFTYLRNNLTTGYADISFTYGIAGDVPVAGHWQLVYPPKPNVSNVMVPPTFVPTPAQPSSSGDSLGD